MTSFEKAKLIIDFFHRTMMHHAMWYAEVQHQMGKEKALKILDEVYKTSYDIQIKRLAKIFDFELNDNVPASLVNLPDESLDMITQNVGINWLANDGVWFQAVEKSYGMNEAKRCNDSCWAQFSPFEAWSIKKFLNLEDKPGIEGLKKAFNYRLYTAINKQSIIEESSESFIFQMNDCRVQSARKRKGLDDYPCKSGGMVEYTTFAEAIDSRIKTECLGCPPDKHPEEWYCAWRFVIAK
ncbi:MAG: cytosolic protein [Bacteroidetes bacterium RIFOXYA12_FULL_35_11]|nr:MAG: cytosolic protein [Bacteroidetes bacterium GWF2_35_48]OFY83585.1 MAG: cytosolic protein [Bacteroidetes bacterium RIFOXYA12_FULL_35_11]OFY95613.1 MAG: cytosolic protein [Bacteroidetes bacterium RIFOXYC12_FULL_35_7]HBX52374.1 cytosolic protein [Bacteroidales bacterium]